MKQNKHLIAGIILVGCVSGGIYAYYTYSQLYLNTDNAYVSANLVNISPKINGYIQHVYVKNNQLVHKGDVLIDIDPADYKLQLAKSKEDLKYTKQQSLIAQQQILTAKANIIKAQSDYKYANQMSNRYTILYNQHSASKQDLEKYVNQENQAEQNIRQAKAALDQATAQYDASITAISTSKISIENSRNNVAYTKLLAPVDGYVTNLNIQTGELVGQGQKIFGIVDNDSWWVNANFKETQLKRIKSGQTATVALDIVNYKYTGQVQSISFASGDTFSLLPSENATGNWVKVTQRFTVMIKLKNNPNFPLRVGASCDVTIDTTK